uniref:Uncharacterized protein n=1 Tax=Chromera velia CCMP2878 TaxID=1169474 RepID=A0A0G4GGJ7_9ALVE|eukprot:Cvel_4674.t1-p1 / transcript=Cvel_4674.t1 / gene=Cvel_4674 / organism=Chromera_velia_CCMP2878 / gene_product=hypothetical protein / transcript_product=hypothetical protein / location=Cvel_scaffold207:7849-13371(+) / protein_length=1199 / sequence_SO=supercontig / SO=protein_coding / is_pseudo=false
MQSFSIDVADATFVITGRVMCCEVTSPSVSLSAVSFVHTHLKWRDSEREMLSGYEDWEGVYCPADRDTSGRLIFHQQSSWRSPSSLDSVRELSFDLQEGKWCVGDGGSLCLASEAAHPAEEPVARTLAKAMQSTGTRDLQASSEISVSALTDFQAAEANEKGGADGKSGKPPKRSSPPRPPRLPKKSPPPAILELKPFNMEDQYASFCRQAKGGHSYQLVKDMIEGVDGGPAATQFGNLSMTGGEEKVLPFAEAFDPEKGDQEAIQSNPCGYLLYGGRNETEGIDGRALMGVMPEGKGGLGINFESVQNCFVRDNTREMDLSNILFNIHEMNNHVENVALPTAEFAGCFFPSSVKALTAPMGIGVESDLGGPCEMLFGGLEHARAFMENEMENNAERQTDDLFLKDCDGNQHSFAKIECDLLCITDAVRAGNRAILQRMENVFHVLQTNTLMMMDYHAAHTEGLIKWLGNLQRWNNQDIGSHISHTCTSMIECPSLALQLDKCRHRARTEQQQSQAEARTGEKTWRLVDCLMEAGDSLEGVSEPQTQAALEKERGPVKEDRSEKGQEREEGAEASSGRALDLWRNAISAHETLRSLVSPSQPTDDDSESALSRRLASLAPAESRHLLQQTERAARQTIKALQFRSDNLNSRMSELHTRIEAAAQRVNGTAGDERGHSGGNAKRGESVKSILSDVVGLHEELSDFIRKQADGLRFAISSGRDREGRILNAWLSSAASVSGQAAPLESLGEALSEQTVRESFHLLDAVQRAHSFRDRVHRQWTDRLGKSGRMYADWHQRRKERQLSLRLQGSDSPLSTGHAADVRRHEHLRGAEGGATILTPHAKPKEAQTGELSQILDYLHGDLQRRERGLEERERGLRERERNLQEREQEGALDRVLDLAAEMRRATTDSIETEQAQMRQDEFVRSRLHGYLSCSDKRGDSEAFFDLLSVWRSANDHRVQSVRAKVEAWKKGSGAMESFLHALGDAARTAEQASHEISEWVETLRSESDFVRLLHQFLPPPSSEGISVAETDADTVALKTEQNLIRGGAEHFCKQLLGTQNGSSGAALEGPDPRLRLAADAALRREAASTVPAFLSTLALEMVVQMKFLSHTLKRSDVWGDPLLLASGAAVQVPLRSEVLAMHQTQEAVLRWVHTVTQSEGVQASALKSYGPDMYAVLSKAAGAVCGRPESPESLDGTH